MRMKDVCSRTGLTDRAVRLYIDSGLLFPQEEISYTGRRSLRFSEEDAAALEVIATLRSAGFSIADIRTMQDTPETIPAVLARHRTDVETEIREKQAVLQKLSRIPDTADLSCRDIAAAIRRDSSHTISIPKEDSFMHLKELKHLLQSRIPSVLALIFAVIGVWILLPLSAKTAFLIRQPLPGGAFEENFTLDPTKILPYLGLFAAVLCLAAAAILLLSRLSGGKRPLLIVSAALAAASALLLLFLPTAVREQLFLFEFLGYRFSFMHNLFSLFTGTVHSAAADAFIYSLKFIPPLATVILAAVGARTEKDLPQE